MPGKREFFLCGKDPYAHAFLALLLCVARQDESCFREICFLRQSLHFRIAQPASIREHRKLVSLECVMREHIEQYVGVAPLFGHKLSSTSAEYRPRPGLLNISAKNQASRSGLPDYRFFR